MLRHVVVHKQHYRPAYAYVVRTEGVVIGACCYTLFNCPGYSMLVRCRNDCYIRKKLSKNAKTDSKCEHFKSVNGRGRRLRTLGLRFWRPPLYQLSYSPIFYLKMVGHQGLEPQTDRL